MSVLRDAGSRFGLRSTDRMETIPQRELRNHVGEVLRRVESGERLRVTVADLVPIESQRTFVPREALVRLLARAPLDRGFSAEIDSATGATIDEL
jgi:prevent-host-death family protein